MWYEENKRTLTSVSGAAWLEIGLVDLESVSEEALARPRKAWEFHQPDQFVDREMRRVSPTSNWRSIPKIVKSDSLIKGTEAKMTAKLFSRSQTENIAKVTGIRKHILRKERKFGQCLHLPISALLAWSYWRGSLTDLQNDQIQLRYPHTNSQVFKSSSACEIRCAALRVNLSPETLSYNTIQTKKSRPFTCSSWIARYGLHRRFYGWDFNPCLFL